jgi:hypothetical protein
MKDVLLYDSLHSYFEGDFLVKLTKTLDKNEGLSLRLIDWFITNYSKKFNIYYLIYETPGGKKTLCETGNKIYTQFNVYQSYKSQLKAYSKKKFDPFCRRERILFDKDITNDSLETTIGQLNFFKWAISNLVIDYIEKHKQDIEEDMNNSLKYIKLDYNNKKKTGTRKKRQELSLSASRGLNKNKLSILLDFD